MLKAARSDRVIRIGNIGEGWVFRSKNTVLVENDLLICPFFKCLLLKLETKSGRYPLLRLSRCCW